MFAMHYFLKDAETLGRVWEFVRGVVEVGGVFMFTTFDGARVVKYLNVERKVGVGESASLFKDGKAVFSIKRLYRETALIELGQEIDVWVETLGGEHKEYLPNLAYLIKYFVGGVGGGVGGGFELVERKAFEEWHKDWLGEATRKKEGLVMSDAEKTFSFLSANVVLKRVN